MRKINGVSLALMVTPFLFSGCLQEKISTIIPVKSTDKKIVLNLEKKSQTYKLNGDVTIESNTTAPLSEEYALETESNLSLIDEPLLTSKTTDTTIEPQITYQTANLEEDWLTISKEDEILQTARQFLGVKYIWAANGPSAFDCSGFTRYVFKQNGINLPRYSGYQATIGQKITFSELKKGDLVFFDTTKEFKKIVNHVGIYIGDHKFIHASSGGKKVIISSFDKKKFYKQKFLFARRVIGNQQNIALSQVSKSTFIN